MEIMVHLRQKDTALDAPTYTGLALLLEDAARYYQRIGFAKYVGSALNPAMDTFVLVEAANTQRVRKLISKIEDVQEVRAFLGPEGHLTDYMDIRILPMMAGGNRSGRKGRTSLEEACRKLKEAIDSGLLSEGALNDAKEEYELLNCDTVLDPLGGGGPPDDAGTGGITPGSGWPGPDTV